MANPDTKQENDRESMSYTKTEILYMSAIAEAMCTKRCIDTFNRGTIHDRSERPTVLQMKKSLSE